jgi:outer membrane biosynthesis protein TonB
MGVVINGRCDHLDPTEFNKRTKMKKNLTYGVIAALAMSGVFGGVSFAADAVTPKPAATSPAATEKKTETMTEKKTETVTEKKPVKKTTKKKKVTKKAPAKSEVKPAEKPAAKPAEEKK